ncbi:MAG: hypothetical protein ACR2IS_11030 [Nitrososphaeraceae archaeon]
MSENDTRKVEDTSKDTIGFVRHSSTYDTNAINRAVEEASRDPSFITDSVQLLKGIQFPAYKHDILTHIKSTTNDLEVISLFESLDGYIQYKDQYHVQNALEENNSEKKKMHQISDTTRQGPEVRTRDTTIDKSIKDTEAVNEGEERKDYPEVAPSAMSNFVCNTCGKVFQNQNDLLQHKRFEGS